jgi:segregation and condensation protein B
MSDLSKKIEAILFYSSEPISINYLVKILESSKADVESALKELSQESNSRGIRLLESQGEYSLVTAPEYSEIIEKMVKEERERDLGRAGIETLAIIAYKGPVSKKEIEYIRGVNSQYALRNLLLRGLVERKASQADERMLQYSITGEAVRFLGLSKIEDLPEYEESRKVMEDVALEETETEENGAEQQD